MPLIENGEVIIGKAGSQDNESASEYSQTENDGIFAKRLSKLIAEK